jgi:hypothetical protein
MDSSPLLKHLRKVIGEHAVGGHISYDELFVAWLQSYAPRGSWSRRNGLKAYL